MREHMKAVTNPEKYVSHPISCFQLIKRLTVNWIDIRETITPKVPANFTGRIIVHRGSYHSESRYQPILQVKRIRAHRD